MAAKCEICKSEMNEGYFFETDGTMYCSDKCLNVHVSDEEYEKLFEDGIGYWTTFDEDFFSIQRNKIYKVYKLANFFI